MLQTITDWIRLFFLKDKESYLCFYKILGFLPKDIHIYEQALLHKSSSVKSGKGYLLNNERLEFLGDAVLDAVVADILYNKFDGKREGFLTNTRSKIVQRETLNKLAIDIGLDKLIKASTRSQSHNNYMCGNAFEALIGAIYVDRGYRACQFFVEQRIVDRFINIDTIAKKEMNFKSKLIEWGQKHKYAVSFELIKQCNDTEGNPIFQTEVLIEGQSGGIGSGYSKKESQQNAAQKALEKIKSKDGFMQQVQEHKKTMLAEMASMSECDTAVSAEADTHVDSLHD